ncbi:MAG: SRPBCC family protein [Rhodospirillales bacterium]|nr:SRPBCC family protein [Rhodospirillales bacterium]
MTDTSDLILSITRIIDAPRDIVWRCWTENDLFMKWYCPKPWRLAMSDMDVRAGGRMNCVMAGPNGERIEIVGSFLEVVPRERLIFTDAYSEGYMPRPNSFMTGVVELSDTDDRRTCLVWSARHATEDAKKQHVDMGFETGWNAAADQLNQLAKTLIK